MASSSTPALLCALFLFGALSVLFFSSVRRADAAAACNMQVYTQDWGSGRLNGLPFTAVDDFDTDDKPSRWQVDRRKHFLRQKRKIKRNEDSLNSKGSALIWNDGYQYPSMTVTFTMRSKDNSKSVMSFVWRYQNSQSYYQFEWSSKKNSKYFRIKKRNSGVDNFSLLSSESVPDYIKNEFYSIRVYVDGGVMNVSIASSTESFNISAYDTDHSTGTFGFYTVANGKMSYDDLIITIPCANVTTLTNTTILRNTVNAYKIQVDDPTQVLVVRTEVLGAGCCIHLSTDFESFPTSTSFVSRDVLSDNRFSSLYVYPLSVGQYFLKLFASSEVSSTYDVSIIPEFVPIRELNVSLPVTSLSVAVKGWLFFKFVPDTSYSFLSFVVSQTSGNRSIPYISTYLRQGQLPELTIFYLEQSIPDVNGVHTIVLRDVEAGVPYFLAAYGTSDALPQYVVDVVVTAPFPTITSIDPTTGGTPGGYLMTIVGKNFGNRQDASVALGGQSCPIFTYTPFFITCVVPAGTGLGHNVSVTKAGAESNKFTFDYDAPLLDSAAIVSAPTIGGPTLTLFGSSFGLTGGVVTVGIRNCVVTSQLHSMVSVLEVWVLTTYTMVTLVPCPAGKVHSTTECN